MEHDNTSTAVTHRNSTSTRAPDTPDTDERSLSELFTELSYDTGRLLRKEVELARAEFSEKASRAMGSIVTMVIGGLLAYAGLIAVVIAAAIALGNLMPYWLSSLAVGIAVIIIGGIFLLIGRSSLKNIEPKPEKTIETLQEDAEWAKEKVT